MWKYLKKESFWKLFAKRLAVVVMCMAVLFCTLLNVWYYVVGERMNDSITSAFEECMEERGGVEAMMEKDARAEYLISVLGAYFKASVDNEYINQKYHSFIPATLYTGKAYVYLKDSATGEILTDSGKKGFLNVWFKDWENLVLRTEEEEQVSNREKTGENITLMCPYVFVKEIDECIRSNAGTNDEEFYAKLLDIYVRGKEFRPGNVRFKAVRFMTESGEPEEENREIADFTPESTEGYVHLEPVSGRLNSFTVLGADEMDGETRMQAENELSRLEYRGGGNRSDYAAKDFWGFYPGKMTFVMSRHLTDTLGKEYDIGLYYEISSFFQDNLSKIRGGAVGCLVLAALIALLWARKTYLTIGAWIAMDDYRKTLIDSMAHDLKTPLMAMGGYAENLKENLHLEKQEYYADAILKNVGYMNEIIRKDLELSRTEKTDQPMKKEKLDLTVLCREFLDRYDEEVKKKNLQVSVRGKCVVRGDRELLERAMDNLVTNAVRYSSEGGVIEVSGSTHVFKIRNTTDIGYSGSLKKLWEPFVRWDESRSGQKGTGLGLSIADCVFCRHRWAHRLKYSQKEKMFECRINLL